MVRKHIDQCELLLFSNFQLKLKIEINDIQIEDPDDSSESEEEEEIQNETTEIKTLLTRKKTLENDVKKGGLVKIIQLIIIF